MITHYLHDIILLLMAAVLLVPLCQRLRLGAIPGFLLAGIVVGPSGLALIHNINNIQHWAEMGVVLLLFVIGIELKPLHLWRLRRLVFGLGGLQVVVTGLILGSLGHFVFSLPITAAILVGPALALSSTAFVLPLITEQKLLLSSYGRAAFAILLLQDLAVIPLLALVPLLMLPELTLDMTLGVTFIKPLVVLGLLIALGRYLLTPILHRVALAGNSEVFTASAVLIVLGTASVTEAVGLSLSLGAFLAGLLISDSAYRHQVMAEIQPFRGLLLGLFFMSMGMSLNLAQLMASPLLSLSLVGLLILLKTAILWPLTWVFGLKPNCGLAVALVLAQSGEFALILLSLAQQSNLLPTPMFQQLLLMILVSMLMTPLLAWAAKQRLQAMDKNIPLTAIKPEPAPIVIAGFGRVGHRIGQILTQAEQPFVALDADAAIVKTERANGHPVFFGDVRQPEVLKTAGAANAKVIIVTLNNAETTEQVIAALYQQYPNTPLFVRGHDLNQCRKLRQLGATIAIPENMEASLELARMTLKQAEIDDATQQTLIEDFRQAYYAQIAAPEDDDGSLQ